MQRKRKENPERGRGRKNDQEGKKKKESVRRKTEANSRIERVMQRWRVGANYNFVLLQLHKISVYQYLIC